MSTRATLRPLPLATALLIVACAVFLTGAAVTTGYFAEFRVSTSTASATLTPMTIHQEQFAITLSSPYLTNEEAPGEAEYDISLERECITWSGFNCIEYAPNLCNHLSLTPLDPAELDQTPLSGPGNPFGHGTGRLIYYGSQYEQFNDPTDQWRATIHAPCFEGECNPSDISQHGQPLPQSAKGQTFRCSVRIVSGFEEVPVLIRSFTKTAYAQFVDSGNMLHISATFNGNPEPSCTDDPNCNSSVMFLPGLQASRLLRPDNDGEMDQLWEPHGNGDVRDLYLDENGKSIRSDIYATEVVDEAYGAFDDVYKTFIEMMDGLKTQDKIEDWAPIPYDWRLSLDDILNNGTKIENGISYYMASATPFIFEELDRLAKNSRTGKVTIIAHSNGGLLAKELMRRLEATGKADMVDKLIFIGSPQLGTPKAIASILHGEGQEFLKGWIMDKPTARTLAKNMPGGYHLLPTEEYFDIVEERPVRFLNTPSTQSLFNTYGTSTETVTEMFAFLKGDEGRAEPVEGDIEAPNILNPDLLDDAHNVHQDIDAWVPPVGVELIQIAGWGLDTIKSIYYTERLEDECTNPLCLRITPALGFTDEGDATVVVPSALATASSTRYWVDLLRANASFDTKWRHSDFTESIPAQELVSLILLGVEAENLPNFVSTSTPIKEGIRKLRYTLHSPLSLGAYDQEGKFTGISTSTFPDTEYPRLIEDIPNSYYLEFGETKILGLEKGSTTISMIGNSLGTFTLEVESIEAGVTVATTTFPDIPVSTGTVVTILQPEGALADTLLIDFDGDGTTDIRVGEDGFTDEDSLILLKHIVLELGLDKKREKRLLSVIERLEKIMKKEFRKPEKKVTRLTKIFGRLEEVIERFSQKGKISSEDKAELLNIVELVRSGVI